MRDILEASIQRVLADHVTPKLLRDCEGGAWPGALWTLLEDSGFTLALAGEAAGGSALPWADVYPMVLKAGLHALPLPLPETMLAAWLLDQSGIGVPAGPLTVADTTAATDAARVQLTRTGGGWRISGELRLVPWARCASHVVLDLCVDDEAQIALIALAGLDRREDLNLAREPRDNLVLDAVPVLALSPWPRRLGPAPVRLYGAMLRSAQMAGAMEGLVQQSVRYACERVQFGKPIGKFQAIQQQLAVLGCESAAAGAGAAFAFEQAGGEGATLAIAAAKTRASEAAGRAASIAHATHGAIGFTYEHTLHFSTRRLWSWRSEFGHHDWWARRIGEAVCGGGAPFWPDITSGRLPVVPGIR